MPESAPPSAKSCRFHSAVRNRRWQAITAVGAGLIVAVWLHSLYDQFYVYFSISKGDAVQVRSSLSSLEIQFFPNAWLIHHLKIDPNDASVESLGRGAVGVAEILFPGPRFGKSEGLVFITIPYWLLLVAFLAIQYAILPKSRPVWKSGD